MSEYTFYGQPDITIINVSNTLASQVLSQSVFPSDSPTLTLFYKLGLSSDNATFAISNSPEWYSREVSRWNLLFWMFCLAINAFNQPTGRLLGLFYPHHALLRASPALYTADAFSVLLHWGGLLWRHGIRKSASLILAARFVDAEGLPDVNAVRAAQHHSAVRVLSFLFGVLPQFIKLWASHQGLNVLPVVIGTAFLGSWVVFELLLKAADLDEVLIFRDKAEYVLRKRQEQRNNDRSTDQHRSIPDDQLKTGLLVSPFPKIAQGLEQLWAMLAVIAASALTPVFLWELYYDANIYLEISSQPWATIFTNAIVAVPVFTSLQFINFISLFFDKSLERLYPRQIIAKWSLRRENLGSLSSVTVAGEVVLFVVYFGTLVKEMAWKGNLIVILLAPFTGFALMIWAVVMDILSKKLGGKDGHLFIHICLPLALFVYRFKSEGTYQPGWLEYLG